MQFVLIPFALCFLLYIRQENQYRFRAATCTEDYTNHDADPMPGRGAGAAVFPGAADGSGGDAAMRPGATSICSTSAGM